jgi:hypothetical protein
MANYLTDREFSDFVHQNIAIPKIYDPINWKRISLDEARKMNLDMNYGIDYVFEVEGEFKTVQERFREKKYSHFSDFTIRYRRDGNPFQERHQSEYYKIKAAYFTYGITNGEKTDLNSCTDFLKFAVIDLKMVYQKIDQKKIVIKDNKQSICSKIGDIMECPIKYNKDQSSSFFPVDIKILSELWGNEIIIAQKGFL